MVPVYYRTTGMSILDDIDLLANITVIRDSNPGRLFSIPGFGIGEFLIRDPGGIMGSRWYHIKNRYY